MFSEKQLEYFKRMVETGGCKSEKQREYFESVIGMKDSIEGESKREMGTDTGEDRREAAKIKKREYMKERRAKAKAQ